ncbi:methyltransferase TYW3-domain-containing protein [Aspergillus pseudoustus]|uniref:tRNA(Phe) 7-[(3-amino-3-carboxypropyl)-4-demethylwyosine(37)-N(4)]-methyltransferase n=1 Tax=Aspergillus pseudoustus TaxID=1810923 RepID=A0ABR4JRI5_9EURO
MGTETYRIPQTFISRKDKILAELSTSDAEYSDLSPKGSVDEGIRDLIQDINTLPGLVTTSSCAGRISVFLEGWRGSNQPEEAYAGEGRKFVPSGGKGAGKWLFVSHEPLSMEGCGARSDENKEKKSLFEIFGMVPGDGKPPAVDKEGHAPRLVRFHFEPMILHIMAATLRHAQPVLSAASSSGFRESGLQSLRCLEADEGPSPIVAVRSAGLALESVIGYFEDDGNSGYDGQGVIRSLVTEEYLQLLVSMSNERFVTNKERKERFRTALLNACSSDQTAGAKAKGKSKPPGWEDAETRRERKRAEGLAKKKLLEGQSKQAYDASGVEDQKGLLDNLDT